MIGDIAGLIAAIAFVLLVGLLAVPLLKLGRVLDEARASVREITEHTVPILDEAADTVAGANAQLEKVDTVTTSAAQIAENASALAALYSSIVGGPAVKVASFAYGFQKAGSRAWSRLRGVDPDDAAGPEPTLRPERARRARRGTTR